MNQVPMASSRNAISARDHIQGSQTASVTLLEYGDYESPACGQAHLIVKQIQERLGDGLRVIYRHFPQESNHTRAQRAAQACEAAGAQHKFWEMHEVLCAHQDHLSDRHLRFYATQVGLDMAQFNHDMAVEAWAERVREDFMSGSRSGVDRAPAFFINGNRHDGLLDAMSLCEAIEAALATNDLARTD